MSFGIAAAAAAVLVAVLVAALVVTGWNPKQTDSILFSILSLRVHLSWAGSREMDDSRVKIRKGRGRGSNHY